MRKLAVVFLLAPLAVFGVCTNTSGGNWSAGSIWSGCSGSGGVPGIMDDVTIADATSVTIDTDASVNSIVSDGALLVDGTGAHTLTLLTAGTGGISLTSDCGSDCYQIDTSAGSAGKELSIACPNVTLACILNYGGSSVNLTYAIISSAEYQIYWDDLGTHTLIAHHNKWSGGYGMFEHYRDNIDISHIWWDAGTGGNFITGDTYATSLSCSISDVTVTNPAIDTAVINTTGRVDCPSISNLAAIGDAGGTHSVSGVAANKTIEGGATDIGYVLIDNDTISGGNSGGPGESVVGDVGSSATSPLTIHNTIGTNVWNGIKEESSGGYVRSYNNLFTQRSSDQEGQGAYMWWGVDHITSVNDVAIENDSGGNLGIFCIRAGSVTTSCAIDNATVLYTSNSGATGTSPGLDFGEGLPSDSFGVSAPSHVRNSLVSGGWFGITDGEGGNPINTYDTSCAAGVGACNNDAFNQNANGAAYIHSSNSTNWQYGATDHPNPAYSDLNNVDPWMNPEATTRTFARCDELLFSLPAGTGSDQHLFGATGSTGLAFQWNGTAAITLQQVYDCMHAPLYPRNPALSTAGTGGTYVGSTPVKPLIPAMP